ncbi:DUF6893 family small protein [Streptomyces sp. NPDC057445]
MHKKTVNKKMTVIGGAAAASAVAALVTVLPDIKRYLRIRMM